MNLKRFLCELHNDFLRPQILCLELLTFDKAFSMERWEQNPDYKRLKSEQKWDLKAPITLLL